MNGSVSFEAFVNEFNEERPHEALAMKATPAELYTPASRAYEGLPEVDTPSTIATFSSPPAAASACRKKINVSTVLDGQRLGITEVDDGIWLLSLMHYDLGYIDLEQRTLQPIDNPFGTRLSPMS